MISYVLLFDIFSFSPSSLSLILYPFCSHLHVPRHDFLSVPRMARFVEVNRRINAWASFMLFYHGKVVFEFAYPVWRTRSIISLAAIRLFPFLQLEPRRQEHENQDRHSSNAGCCFFMLFRSIHRNLWRQGSAGFSINVVIPRIVTWVSTSTFSALPESWSLSR